MTRSHVTILLILGRGGLLVATARRGGALLHTPRNVVAGAIGQSDDSDRRSATTAIQPLSFKVILKHHYRVESDGETSTRDKSRARL